jgi:hypothetical protein
MKARRYKVKLAPFTTLEAEIVVHPSLVALRREYRRLIGDAEKPFAFCRASVEDNAPVFSGLVMCSLHFSRPHLTPDTVAHEALHAALLYKDLGRLVLEREEAEELVADIVENLTREILRGGRW